MKRTGKAEFPGGEHAFHDVFRTSWGWVAALASARGLLSLSLPSETQDLAMSDLAVTSAAAEHRRGAFEHLALALEEYFKGAPLVRNETLDWGRVSPFQRRVLQAVAAIPSSRTATYREIAAGIGKPGAARAVGRALARNPFPVLIPCHRVIASDGSLRGFRGGLDMKRRLLLLDGCSLPSRAA
ncbi:MAG: MGMT family protein [Chloroflexi bacterium]|nr:MGMT family protein [Chloroflexota bacterium]